MEVRGRLRHLLVVGVDRALEVGQVLQVAVLRLLLLLHVRGRDMALLLLRRVGSGGDGRAFAGEVGEAVSLVQVLLQDGAHLVALKCAAEF